jgi:2'-5' RNA ligase
MNRIKNFEEYSKYAQLQEKNGQTYSKGCVMAYLENLMPEFEKIHSKIDNSEIYTEDEDKSYGLENEPHVTVLYGIHSDEVPDDEVVNTMSKMEWKQPLVAKNPSLFENEKYDVLKLEVEGEWLHGANKDLRERFPYSNDYPDYRPHATIAYLKPGKGKEVLARLGKLELETIPTKMVYSLPSGEKKVVK